MFLFAHDFVGFSSLWADVVTLEPWCTRVATEHGQEGREGNRKGSPVPFSTPSPGLLPERPCHLPGALSWEQAFNTWDSEEEYSR